MLTPVDNLLLAVHFKADVLTTSMQALSQVLFFWAIDINCDNTREEGKRGRTHACSSSSLSDTSLSKCKK
jgi:hypothetical protein